LILNVAVSSPALTVNDAGKLAAFELLCSFTTLPPFSAGPVSVTTPTEEAPPATADGLSANEATLGRAIVRLVSFETPPLVAVIFATCCFETTTVCAVTFAELWPDGIVIIAGTVAVELLLDKETVIPAGPATPFRPTVTVEESPPATVPGLTPIDASDAGPIVRPAVLDSPLNVAVMITDVEALTPDVPTVNVTLLLPPETVTDAGTDAAGLLLESVTVEPVNPAGPLSVTVAVELAPPTTAVGFKVTDANDAGITLSGADCQPPPVSAMSTPFDWTLTAVVGTGKLADVEPAEKAIVPEPPTPSPLGMMFT
jgi:hypothetical protein